MSQDIKVNLDVIEMMLFYWESVASKDKMSDEYFMEIANKEEMKVLYKDGFSPESVRRVLSCISNREKLNNTSKEESKFWSQNMRMVEDLRLLHSMIEPVKHLNLSTLKEKLSNKSDIEVIFLPFPDGDYIVCENKIYFNFFGIIAKYQMQAEELEVQDDAMLKVDVSFHGTSIKQYVESVIEKNY